MATKIQVVDDDLALAEMIGIVLAGEGFDIIHSADGISAVDDFLRHKPDLVLLDLMLPGQDGIEVCRQIRAQHGTPIVMLTAKSETDDVVRGLESGADDYVVKPFNPPELVARVRARLRDVEQQESTPLRVADIQIDPLSHRVTRGGEVLSLTPLEFSLLLTLAKKPQQVFTREQLLEQVWGYKYKADTRLVNVHVQRLRAKIEHDPDQPQIIITVRGVGYRAGDEG